MDEGRADQGNAAVPPVVVVLNRDVMFAVQIGNVVRAAGCTPRFVRTTEAFCAGVGDQPRPVLGIVDMNGEVDWEEIRRVAAVPENPPLLGFGPHVDVASRRAAKAAGLTRIVSNGEFHQSMAVLIARYAREEPTASEGASSD